MKLRPIYDRIVVKPISEEEVRKSGIAIPETVDKAKPERGEVVAVSKDLTSVKVGDKIVFKKYSPDEIKTAEGTFLVLKADDVLVIIE